MVQLFQSRGADVKNVGGESYQIATHAFGADVTSEFSDPLVKAKQTRFRADKDQSSQQPTSKLQ